MFRSLNSRLLLSYIAVILTCLALVGLGLLLFARPLWTGATVLRLEAAVRATLPAILQADSPKQRLDLLAQAAADQGIRTLLVDDTATVRFDSEGTWEGQQLDLPARVRGLRSRLRGIFVTPDGDRWTFAGQALPETEGGRQAIFFVAPQSALLMLVWFAQNLLLPLVEAGAVALVLSVLLALLVSRSVAAPLRRVAGAAEAIARGRTGARAPVSGPSEAQALARSFNTMAEQVTAAQRSQRDFVANVSHELKTPLTSIQGFSQALLDGAAATPEAQQQAARVIHEEAGRMRGMVDELLTLARFDAGQMEMARAPAELGFLLRGCVEKLSPQAQAGGVNLELDSPTPLTVPGDADRLAQVFTNLLDNAVAHTPAGGKVAVAARAVDGGRTIQATVTDTGEGIPAEALPRIFERFYQVDPSRRRSRGAGLGLAIAREIVVAHGGTITVESTLGLGSRFTVRLPASAPP